MGQKGVNKVILIGNLGQDPEVRYFPNGGSVCSLSVATSESWRDKNTGEQKELTEWHRLTIKQPRLVEIAGEYLKKGAKVYIEGRLRTRKWQDQNGQDRYSTEINVDQLQMLDTRPVQEGQQQAGQFGNRGGQYGNQQQGRPQNAPRNNGGNQNHRPPMSNEPPTDFEDLDIPF